MFVPHRVSTVAAWLALTLCSPALVLVSPAAALAGQCNPDNPPESEDDFYSTPRDTTLEADGVLDNDTDTDGDAMIVRLEQDVSHGTLELDDDGSFTYTPDFGFSGDDTFTYVANDGCTEGNEATVTITVGPCTYVLDPTGEQVGAAGGDRTVDVDAPESCSWTATTGAAWIALPGTTSGSGPGTVPYSVQENESVQGRTGAVTIATASLTVRQLGAAADFDISPDGTSFPQEGGVGTVEVTATPGAGWAASSSAGWLQIVGPAGGDGDGSVDYAVDPNTSPTARTARLTIAGRTFTVMQAAGVTRSLTPWSLAPGDSAGAAPAAAATAIGVFGIEDQGRSRGPWLQLYDDDGSRLANAFLPSGLEDAEVFSAQLDGTGDAEIVVVGPRAAARGDGDGAHRQTRAELFIRNADGSGAARQELFGGDAVDDVTPLVVRGDGETLVGVGAVRQEDGAALWQLLRFEREIGGDGPVAAARGSLVSLGEHEVVTEEFGPHGWSRGDLDGDGRDEVLIGFADPDGTGASFRVLDPETGAVKAERNALGGAFENATWMLGRFRRGDGSGPAGQGTAGLQVLVGAQRAGTGAGFAALFDGDGRPVMRGTVTDPGVEELSWRRVGNGAIEEVQELLVGYRDRAGFWAYEIRDLSDGGNAPGRSTSARAVVAEQGSDVMDWIVGDFDGQEANGQEVAVITTDRGDRGIGASTWDRFGQRVGPSASAFDGEHVDPRALAARPVDPGRDDLVLLVNRVGESPRILVMRFDGEELLERRVLGSDAR